MEGTAQDASAAAAAAAGNHADLPPAARRLESLEFDPLGNPYFKFPPFLPPPEGVALISYDKFKPHGIQIRLDPDQQEELDGEGIPTVLLGARHDAGDPNSSRKRKKKRILDIDHPRKSSHWWEDWAEGEDLRRTVPVDPKIPRGERFGIGAAEFARGRKFLPPVQSLYDHFRRFIGLLVNQNGDKYGRDADDDLDDEAELNEEGAAAEKAANSNERTEVVVATRDDGSPYIAEIDEETDLRVETFLNDPEKSIKIFFSSFYKDKGLAWSATRLRDGPMLVEFFFSYFLRNRIMPDYHREFTKAHQATQLARLELPQTSKISIALPDYFGRACYALWGNQRPLQWASGGYVESGMWEDTKAAADAVPGPAPEPVAEAAPEPTPAPPPAPASEPAPVAQSVDEWESQMRERGLEKVEIGDGPNGWGDAADDDEEATAGGWGDPSRITIPDPWDTSAIVQDWNGGEPEPSLMVLLGPTTLPLTHSVKRAEKAMRQVVSFAPPQADGAGLERVLGTITLAPWTRYYKGTAIRRPEMFVDNAPTEPFDSARETIRVFVNPEVIATLREGMGMHGVFVQLSRNDAADLPKDPKPKSRGKGKGKTKRDVDKEWWYVEFVYEVVPSFWTEDEELE